MTLPARECELCLDIQFVVLFAASVDVEDSKGMLSCAFVNASFYFVQAKFLTCQ